MSQPYITPVHFIGSIPLSCCKDVFQSLTSNFASDRLRRIPDGETSSQRRNFTAWQYTTLARAGKAHLLGNPFEHNDDAPAFTEDDVRKEMMDFPDLDTRYDAEAIASYATFAALQSASEIPQTTRFQVCLTTAVNCMPVVNPAFQAAIEPNFEKALVRASRNIQAAIPHDRLAIQIDLPLEFAWLHGAWFDFWTPQSKVDYIGEPKLDRLIQRVVTMAESVDEDVELGFHLCYGDAQKQHFVQPQDTNMLVDVALALIAAVRRPITWLHIPVPKARDDDAYFEALARLVPKLEQTELYLGLIHEHDPEGTESRIRAAKRHVSQFGIATECGLGRRNEKDLQSVLEIMRDV